LDFVNTDITPRNKISTPIVADILASQSNRYIIFCFSVSSEHYNNKSQKKNNSIQVESKIYSASSYKLSNVIYGNCFLDSFTIFEYPPFNFRLQMVKTVLKIYRLLKPSKPVFQYLSALTLFLCFSNVVTETILAQTYSTDIQMNIPERQMILNGRIWRNQYAKASGDQFFITNTFVKGSVVFNGKKFDDLDLMYDIAGDELIMSIVSHPTIIVNKEMVDSFDLFIGNRIYHIINAGTDTTIVLRGYVNVLYVGPSTLFVKYIKKLQPLAVDGRYDLFYQEHSMYIKKNTEIVAFEGKNDLLKILSDKKEQLKGYLKTGKIKLSRKDPESFIPVLEYYDRLKE